KLLSPPRGCRFLGNRFPRLRRHPGRPRLAAQAPERDRCSVLAIIRGHVISPVATFAIMTMTRASVHVTGRFWPFRSSRRSDIRTLSGKLRKGVSDVPEPEYAHLGMD